MEQVKFSMLHHISLPVSNLPVATTFYDSVLAELGYRKVCHGDDYSGYGVDEGEDKFCIKQITPSANAGPRFHLAFTAASEAAVSCFHETALSLGAKNQGNPGLRPDYGPNYYAAFVSDLDGHRIEAVYNPPLRV